MGRDVEHRSFSAADRHRFGDKLHRNLEALTVLLRETPFDDERPMTGLEIELNLVDAAGSPANLNTAVLANLADPAFQTEMGRFNLEINVPPRELGGRGFAEVEAAVRASLDAADERAVAEGGRLVMTGILPTLMPDHVRLDSLSEDPRYAVLNEQIFAVRGEDLQLSMQGVEELTTSIDSITPEGACTSVQLHLQVGPAEFAAYWNAAQALSGIQLAVGANSPYLFGRQLWCETRVPLFEQATDTRSAQHKEQGVRPRVWFGERWVTSVSDLFEENARYFPALLPICEDDDPLAQLAAGETPPLAELALHNGTIYRWNRPIYDVVGSGAAASPHLRVENRVLPAGPTVVDVMANAAFYYGLVRTLATADRPIWTRMSFSAAEQNFHSAARHGIDAEVWWPDLGRVAATELVLRTLLPMAHDGLTAWGVDAADRDRLLGIVESRAAKGVNGAAWQVRTVQTLEAAGRDRTAALHAMLERYVANMHTNEPVHTWA